MYEKQTRDIFVKLPRNGEVILEDKERYGRLCKRERKLVNIETDAHGREIQLVTPFHPITPH
jgi:hypothetical protein